MNNENTETNATESNDNTATETEITAEASSSENSSDEGVAISPESVMSGMVKATFLPGNQMLIVDLSTLVTGTERPGVVDEAVARAYASPDQP